MTNRNDPGKTDKQKGGPNPSRRNVLTGSGALLAGGIAGRATSPKAAAAQNTPDAPELPWPWAPIDPMEAGSRTYKAYLTQGG